MDGRQILRIALAVVQTACLLSALTIVLLACSESFYRWWRGKIAVGWRYGLHVAVLLLGFFGMWVWVKTGSELLLDWIPSKYGSFDEDGDFIWSGEAISNVSAMIVALGFMVALEQLISTREKYNRLRLFARWQEDIYSAPTVNALDGLILTLKKGQDPLHIEYGYLAHKDRYGHPAKKEADVYEELIGVAERRKRRLELRSNRHDT